jgi:hypothetical protein
MGFFEHIEAEFHHFDETTVNGTGISTHPGNLQTEINIRSDGVVRYVIGFRQTGGGRMAGYSDQMPGLDQSVSQRDVWLNVTATANGGYEYFHGKTYAIKKRWLLTSVLGDGITL